MEKQKNKSIGSNIIIVLLILIILASSAIGIFAWAKYQSAISGTAQAQVAKWSFKLVDGDTQTTDTIEFAVTRTDSNTTVAENKLAPGTYGQFDIGIDATGTETILQYVIDVDLENKPTNLKFYLDSKMTEEIEVIGDNFQKTGFMSLEDVKEIRTETIYWNWPYQTGGTDEEIKANDKIDTQDAGKEVTMRISVTGTEVLEMPEETPEIVLEQKDIQITSPETGTYYVGEEITIQANFSKEIYAGTTLETITQTTAPEMKVKVGNGTEKTAQFKAVNGSAIEYTYTVEEGDEGVLELVSYSGTVYDEDGESLAVESKELTGSSITIDIQIKTLADVVEVGDYVNYDATAYDEDGNVYSYTTESTLTGTTSGISTFSATDTFNSAAKSQWRVLSKNTETKEVVLMAADPTAQTVMLKGIDGYANAETVLNNVGAVYGHGEGATAGRSITIEDIEQFSNYDKTTFVNSDGFKYGDTNSYTFKTPGNTSVNLAGSEMKKLTGSEENPTTVQQTSYYYTAQNYFDSTIYNMIFKKSSNINSNKSTYWLASRRVALYSSTCNFDTSYVTSGSVGGHGLYVSNGYEYSPSYACTPVVSLKQNIQTIGKNTDGVWELKID